MLLFLQKVEIRSVLCPGLNVVCSIDISAQASFSSPSPLNYIRLAAVGQSAGLTVCVGRNRIELHEFTVQIYQFVS